MHSAPDCHVNIATSTRPQQLAGPAFEVLFAGQPLSDGRGEDGDPRE